LEPSAAWGPSEAGKADCGLSLPSQRENRLCHKQKFKVREAVLSSLETSYRNKQKLECTAQH